LGGMPSLAPLLRSMGVHGFVNGRGRAIGLTSALLFKPFHGRGLLLWTLLSVFSSAPGVGFFNNVRF
jgi:hypothetical protein